MPSSNLRTDLENNGLDRLIRTFKPDNSKLSLKEREDNLRRLCILGRVIAILRYNRFEICGQPPDYDYSLGEYIMHGGRLLFDLSQLNRGGRKFFREFILLEDQKESPIYSRSAATHAFNDFGKVRELKLGTLKSTKCAIQNLFNGSILRNNTGHWGLDIPIGGYGNTVESLDGKEHLIDSSGKFGHLYILCNGKYPNAVMVGLEESKPARTNKVSNDTHGINGQGGKYSACIVDKIGNMQSANCVDRASIDKYSSRARMTVANIDFEGSQYNWNRVFVTTKDMLCAIESRIDHESMSSFLLSPHPRFIHVKSKVERYRKMLAYRLDDTVEFIKSKIISENNINSHESCHIIKRVIDDIFSLRGGVVGMITSLSSKYKVNLISYLPTIQSLSVQYKICKFGGLDSFILGIENEPLTSEEIRLLAAKKN
ncbi:hypothetical protein [Piscirickettsia litoralis]|uniref:Uncharacterized protein n=1 Tax=Piscirickettsia litoralis TaxID=1891921 RepID=A0ABX3A104_9GAMM|nr:hypothetical protein [Piscirickettsia litoralis]ODN42556.1 hypothetical protein BGC07_05955 [Piscirickettsia litoralis]